MNILDHVLMCNSMRENPYHSFLIKYGLEFKVIADDLPFSRGEMKRCYANSAERAWANRDFYYVEGLACIEDYPVPLEHAWLVDRDGKVFDPTWEDGVSYFGVPFRASFVREMAAYTGYYGILVNGSGYAPWLNNAVPESKFLQSIAQGVRFEKSTNKK